jgi:FkbM family methyltransferase
MEYPICGKGKVRSTRTWIIVASACIWLLAVRRWTSEIDRKHPCAISGAATHGLICVQDDLWYRILSDDKIAWDRQRAKVLNQASEGNNPLEADWRLSRCKYLGALWIPTFSCPDEVRVGRAGDGGKWLCGSAALQNSSEGNCLVYSFGSNNDFSFEEDVIARFGQNCEIHVFDHTVKNWALPDIISIKAHNWGLVGTPEKRKDKDELKTISEIMSLLGHRDREITALKMDVEGAEFSALRDVAQMIGPKPRQIIFEMHLAPSPVLDHETASALMLNLREASYHMFHMEPTYWDALVLNEYSFMLLN